MVIYNKYNVYTDFIFQYFELRGEKIYEKVELEDWNPIQTVPNLTQNIITFIIKNNISELKTSKIYFETEQPSEEKDSNNNLKTLLDLGSNNSFKILHLTNELIYFMFDTIKLIIYFDNSLIETIVYQFVKILNQFLTISKNIIIEGEGVKKGRLKSISQKEISMLAAISNIGKSIIISFIKYFSSSEAYNEKQEIVLPALNDSLKQFEKLISCCKEKIYELFKQIISASIEELSKIDLLKYPIFDKDYNIYCKKFAAFKTLYNHMINAFENDEIISIFNENLNIYFEKLEKAMLGALNGSKVESDTAIKQ